MTQLKTKTPLVLVRLGSAWKPHREEIEPGYFRAGGGWFEGIDSTTLRDSVRAWWKLSPKSLEDRGVEHVVAVVQGRTVALFAIESVFTRRSDGKAAFILKGVTRGPLFDEVVGPSGKSVEFAWGAANPIIYWPPKSR